MNRLMRAVLGIFAVLMLANAAHAAEVFVYKGAGCDGRKAMPSFEAVLGRKADGVVDFSESAAKTGYTGPQAMSSSIGWGNWCWKGSGYNLAQSVPMAFSDTSLAQVAAGKADADYVKVAKGLVANGFDHAYVRLGWEFNGGWYYWGFKGHEGDWKNAFRHVALIFRANCPNCKIVWNPALYEQQQWPDWVWPGDDVIDVIATDAYGEYWGTKDPATIIKNTVSNTNIQWNVQAVVAFAKKHNKPYAFPEWGTGSQPQGYSPGDSPEFIAAMKPYVDGAIMAGYWDYPAGDYDASFAHNPKTAAAFKAAFGTGSAPPVVTPPVVTPPPVVVPPAPPPVVVPPSPPVVVTPPAPVVTVTATVTPVVPMTVAPNTNGSATLNLTTPKATGAPVYIITLSEPRKLGWGDGKGGLRGSLWSSGYVYTRVVMSSPGEALSIYVAPK